MPSNSETPRPKAEDIKPDPEEIKPEPEETEPGFNSTIATFFESLVDLDSFVDTLDSVLAEGQSQSVRSVAGFMVEEAERIWLNRRS